MKIQAGPSVARSLPVSTVSAATVAGDHFVAGTPPPSVPENFLRQQRLQLLHSFLAEAPGIAAPSELEKRQLCENLDRVDTGVLSWLSRAGVGFVVLHQGDDLAQSQLLRRQSLQEWRQQLPACRQAGEELHQQRLQEQSFPWQNLKPPVSMFQPRSDGPLGPRLTTLEVIAAHHGARNPEEKQLFYQLVEELNGPRLAEARQENEAKLRDQGFERDPSLVPVDPLKHTLLFPDLYFCGPTLLDGHDFQTLQTWHGGGAQVSFQKSDNDEWNGQYLYLGDQKRVLVRNTVLQEKTPIHELGHALDMQLETQDPGFYAGFHTQLVHAFNRAGSNSQAISNYALANLREYFAEGFAHYHLDAAKLKKQDPALNALVEAACQHACQLAGFEAKSGRNVRQQLAELPKQVNQSLEQLAHDPVATRDQLNKVSQTLKARSGQDTALLAVSYGLMAGAADAVLRYSLGQLAEKSPTAADVTLEQAAAGPDAQVAFDTAYGLASGLLA